jgi:hypothetical protein
MLVKRDSLLGESGGYRSLFLVDPWFSIDCVQVHFDQF